TCSYSQAPDPSSGTNTAKATWDPTGQMTGTSGSATGPQPYDFGTATPTPADDCVSVSDPLDSASPRTFCVGDTGEVDNGDGTFSFAYTHSHTVTGAPAGRRTSHDNTATFVTNTSGTKGSDGATVKDCQGADLTVKKDATPSFTRSFTWGISKSVDKTLVEQ